MGESRAVARPGDRLLASIGDAVVEFAPSGRVLHQLRLHLALDYVFVSEMEK